MPGYQHGYQVNKIEFLADKQLSLAIFRGAIYG